MPGVALHFQRATDLARLVRTKQVSARELLGEHLRQIERVNPTVNAIITLDLERAALAAADADERQARGEMLGPLHGLPAVHKDLFETADLRTTYGSKLFEHNRPTQNDPMVESLQRAGAITLGKTNTPEFGVGSQTFNDLFGATRNPYDLSKTCGGSSGGSAVALACGMSPLADGTDVGGSLRNPASFCNVVGLRPSIGRVPNPRAALPWLTFGTSGCMGRTVADVALVMNVIDGPDARSPLSIDEPGSIFSQPLDRDLRGTRVAWFRDLGGVPFDPVVRAVVNEQRKTFEALGCVVEEAEPDFGPVEHCFRTLRAYASAHTYGPLLRARPDSLKTTLREEVERGLALPSSEIASAEAARAQLWRSFQTFFQRYEYFILPTVQLPPFDVETEYPTEVAGMRCPDYIDWMKSCWYISASGHPAVSVPAGFTDASLPVGLQIVGRNRADFAVLQLAHAFEQATGFGARRPSIATIGAV